MKVTKITIRTDTGKKITIKPNDTHDVSLIESPIIVYAQIDDSRFPCAINSITAVVIHPKSISTDSIASVIKQINH